MSIELPLRTARETVQVSELDKVIEGDCLDVLPTLLNDSVDLVVTDPPYLPPAQTNITIRGERPFKRSLSDASISRQFFKQVFQELDRVLKRTGAFYVFCDGQSYSMIFECLYPFCQKVRLLVWDKLVAYNGYVWRHQHELIAFGEREALPRIATGDGDILRFRGVRQNRRLHPAEKPVALISKLILKHGKVGTVLDPFAGSGSTLVAAQQAGWHYLGIELDSDCVKIANERLAKLPISLDAAMAIQ